MDTQAESKLIQCVEIEKELRPQKVSKFRRYLPQVRETLFSRSEISKKVVDQKWVSFVDFGCNSEKSHYSQHNTVCSISIDRDSITAWFKWWIEYRWIDTCNCVSSIMDRWACLCSINAPMQNMDLLFCSRICINCSSIRGICWLDNKWFDWKKKVSAHSKCSIYFRLECIGICQIAVNNLHCVYCDGAGPWIERGFFISLYWRNLVCVAHSDVYCSVFNSNI